MNRSIVYLNGENRRRLASGDLVGEVTLLLRPGAAESLLVAPAVTTRSWFCGVP